MPSTPWKPASIKTSHQHNFTFHSQFAEITRWLLNSGPVSTFRKRLSRAVAGWVGAGGGGGSGNVFNPNLTCANKRRKKPLSCTSLSCSALKCAALSACGFPFLGGGCKYYPSNDLKHQGLLSGLWEGGRASSLGSNGRQKQQSDQYGSRREERWLQQWLLPCLTKQMLGLLS